MSNNLVSIVIPCYKQSQYLDEVLQSVLDQVYVIWECIIVSDGSPDNTEEVVKGWVAKDSRFKYFYKENGGLSSARNFGIEHAQGEFILPLDADDRIGSSYIDLAIESFYNNDSLKLVYCKAEKFGEEFGEWTLQPFSIYDICRFNMIFCSAVFRKKDWVFAGGYDINLIYGLEDWEFWISILKNGGDVKCLNYVGFYYRIRNNSMARIINIEERKFSQNYIARKHIEFFITNYDILNGNRKNISNQLKSEKFIINLFTKKFFGFEFFKKQNINFLK